MKQDQRIGSEVAGYRIESVIGRGGMSVVYLAEQDFPRRKVALKLLPPDLSEDAAFRERFVRESNLAASIDHPNIVPIYGAGQADGLLYIAMRYVEGIDLKGLLAKEGRLTPERAIAFLGQVASALDTAHARGLVHRDVKPANILIASRSDPDRPEHVYLSDFGLTKRALSDSGLTGSGQFLGTLDYAAPEQFEGGRLDGRADVYSLGCVLFECLAGEVPFGRDRDVAVMYAHLLSPAPSITEKRPELPPEVDKAIERAMAKAPQDRYATGGELMDGFQKAIGPPRPPPGAPAAAADIGRGKRRRMLAAGAVAVLVAAVAISVAVVATKGGGKPVTSPSTGIPVAARYSLQRIDPGAGARAKSIRLKQAAAIILVGSDGTVWTSNGSDRNFQRLDPSSGRITSIRTPKPPNSVAFGLGAVWFTSEVSNDLFRMDAATNKVTSQISLPGSQPSAVAVDEETGSVWVAVQLACSLQPGAPFICPTSVARIDPTSDRVTGSVDMPPLAGIPVAMATGNGSLWIAAGQPTVYRIDEQRTKLAASIEIGGSLGGIAVDPATQSVWVTTVVPSSLAGTLVKIDATTNKIVDRIGVSCCPGNVVVSGGLVWTTDGINGTVPQVSPVSDEVTDIITVGKMPVALGAGRDAVWVGVDRS